MNEKAILRALKVHDQKRAYSLNLTACDPATIANGHEPQYKLLGDDSRRIIVLCSRRAGKSVAVCSKMAYLAQKYPNSIIIYFGATSKAVRLLIWGPVWKTFRKAWGIGGEDNETLMLTRFANGSVVAFAGTDDYRHVETFLGGKLRAVFIDEAQSQPTSVLLPLVDRILPPALSDLNGTLMLSGTIPEVEAGLFYEIWKDTTKYSSWSRHTWNRFANPHIESKNALTNYLVDTGHSIEDPIVQRDWLGKFIFDAGDTAFRYSRDKAGYSGAFPNSLELFSVGIDPGTRDRTAIIVWGWGQHDAAIWHVHEWVTKRDSHTTLSQIVQQLKDIKSRFQNVPWVFFDMGGSNLAIDTFTRDHGLPVFQAAKKTDRLFQVRRFADLLNTGKCKIKVGSYLEEDLKRAQWDKDKRGEGKYEWSSVWHPDVADAARYGLQGYFDAYVKPKEKVDLRTGEQLREERLWRESLQPPVEQTWKSDLDEMGFGYGKR